MIRIGLAEQNKRIAEVLKEKIELSPDFKVDLISEGGMESLDTFADRQYDLMIIDGGFFMTHGAQLIREYTQRLLILAAKLPLVLASSFVDIDQQISALTLGARGVLNKSDQPEKIHQALFQSIEGGMKLSWEIRKSFAVKFEALKAKNSLKEDDLELGLMISQGKSIEFIGMKLYRPKNEIAKRIQELFKKVFSD